MQTSVSRSDTHKRQLTPQQQAFVKVMQHIRYGCIHRVPVKGGQPVVDSDLQWTRKIKVQGENTPHPKLESTDFALREPVIKFFALLEQLGDGELHNLEIRNGLPLHFELIERAKT